MKISTKGRFALRLMVDLTEQGDGAYVSLKDIALRQDISVKYLEQIVSVLAKGGLLLSNRGPKGGYRLAKPADEYVVGEILRAAEGDLSPVFCLTHENVCDRADICPTRDFWQGLYDAVNDYVDSVTLDQLAGKKAYSMRAGA